MVPFTGNQLECAWLLSAHIRAYGTPQAIALADAFDNATNALLSGNQALYNAAEDNYEAVNAGTTPDLEDWINQFFLLHPECDTPE